MKIVKYNGALDIWVEFENGFLVNGRYEYFKEGSIKNPYTRTIRDKGYYGEGKFLKRENGKDTIAYKSWVNMIERCYSEKIKEKRPTYENCIVDEYLLNFQNYAKFYYENMWKLDESMIPDKDILCHGKNKVYSIDTILFVDKSINSLFVKCDSKRENLPIGVTKYKNKFKAQCQSGSDGLQFLGYYNTSEEAFLAYKKFKESYIKKVADDYKAKYPNFPTKLYEAMYNYQVEITD